MRSETDVCYFHIPCTAPFNDHSSPRLTPSLPPTIYAENASRAARSDSKLAVSLRPPPFQWGSSAWTIKSTYPTIILPRSTHCWVHCDDQQHDHKRSRQRTQALWTWCYFGELMRFWCGILTPELQEFCISHRILILVVHFQCIYEDILTSIYLVMMLYSRISIFSWFSYGELGWVVIKWVPHPNEQM